MGLESPTRLLSKTILRHSSFCPGVNSVFPLFLVPLSPVDCWGTLSQHSPVPPIAAASGRREGAWSPGILRTQGSAASERNRDQGQDLEWEAPSPVAMHAWHISRTPVAPDCGTVCFSSLLHFLPAHSDRSRRLVHTRHGAAPHISVNKA